MVYARTCQECGHIQESKPLDEMKTEPSAKCRKCKNDSLDYGHSGFEWKDGKLVRKENDDWYE